MRKLTEEFKTVTRSFEENVRLVEDASLQIKTAQMSSPKDSPTRILPPLNSCLWSQIASGDRSQATED